MKIPHSTAPKSSLTASIYNASTALFSLTKHSRRVPSDEIMVGTRQGLTVQRAMTMGLVCLGMLAVESEAAITFSNPFRSVSASNNRGSSQQINTDGFGQFNESARVDWEEYWTYPNSYFGGTYPDTTGHYYSVATQDSVIGLTEVSVKGTINGSGSYEYYGNDYHQQHSQSHFKVDFSIDASSDVYLKGSVFGYVDLEGYNSDLTKMKITLSGVNGDIYSRIIGWDFFSDFRYDYIYEINESFTTLEAGDYVFEVSSETDGYYFFRDISQDDTGEVWITPGEGGYGRISYDITLVPEPSTMLLAGLAGVLLIRRKR